MTSRFHWNSGEPISRRAIAVVASALLAVAGTLAFPAAADAAEANSGSYPDADWPATMPESTITWWTWTANAKNIVKAFNKVYPNVHVETPLIGKDYTKLTTVIEGGTGGPDVASVEYQYMPKYIATGGLLDISKYVDQYKDLFYPWAWNQVSQGSKVYGLPQDTGPTSMTYQPAIFEQDGLSVPKTWAEYAEDAKIIHEKDPSKYITFLPTNDGGWWMMAYWQAGAVLFQNTPQGWKISIDSKKAREVTEFWGKLADEGLVDAVPDWTPAWQHTVGQGTYATINYATWTPDYMVHPFANKATIDGWRETDMPQWSSDEFVGANVGGAANVVLKQSKNPAAAALFAAWIDGAAPAVSLRISSVDDGGQGLTAAAQHANALPQFRAPSAALNGQDPSGVIDKASASVDPDFQWSPWTDYVFDQMTIEFSNAAAGKQSWDQALEKVQHSTAVFGASMGYKIAPSSSPNSDSPPGATVLGIPPQVAAVLALAILAAAAIVYARRRARAVSA